MYDDALKLSNVAAHMRFPNPQVDFSLEINLKKKGKIVSVPN
jgi:hypothetical protein